MPRIDGTDALSRDALALLEQGQPLVALEGLGLTKDQAKKLGRLRVLLAAAAPHLPTGALEKLGALGLKAVALAPLVQAADWSGLVEILQTIDPSAIKREELQYSQEVLAAKRARVAEVEGHLRPKIKRLEEFKQERAEALERLKVLEAEVQEHFRLLEPFVSGFDDKVREVLLKHLAVEGKGRLCLARRLDWSWQEDLKARGVIRQQGSVMLVTNLAVLVDELKERMRRKGWEERVYYSQYRTPHNGYGYVGPWKPEYKLAKPLPDEVQERIRDTKERLKALGQEIKQAEAEIKELRHRTPLSFMEAVQAANQMSKQDLETHARLQAAGMAWLYEQGHVATAELTTGNRRWDVAGFDQAGSVTIIEAKASINDFRRDDKWREYTAYSDRFFFVVEEWMYSPYNCRKELDATGAGVLIVDRQGKVQVARECTLQLQAQDREATRWAIGRALAKRVVFGF